MRRPTGHQPAGQHLVVGLQLAAGPQPAAGLLQAAGEPRAVPAPPAPPEPPAPPLALPAELAALPQGVVQDAVLAVRKAKQSLMRDCLTVNSANLRRKLGREWVRRFGDQRVLDGMLGAICSEGHRVWNPHQGEKGKEDYWEVDYEMQRPDFLVTVERIVKDLGGFTEWQQQSAPVAAQLLKLRGGNCRHCAEGDIRVKLRLLVDAEYLQWLDGKLSYHPHSHGGFVSVEELKNRLRKLIPNPPNYLLWEGMLDEFVGLRWV